MLTCLYFCLQSNVCANNPVITATHDTDTPIYASKTRITMSTTITYSYTDIASLGLEISIPENWKFISFSDTSLPLENNNGLITTYWVNIPDHIDIQYDLEIPENEMGVKSIAAMVKYRRHGIDDPLDVDVLPNPFQLASSGFYITANAKTGGQIVPAGKLFVVANQSQSFTIQPDLGYTINALFVDNQPVSKTNIYLFDSVTENHLIDVSFQKEQYQLKIETITDGGTVFPSGLMSVDYGTIKHISVSPDMGYVIDRVLVDGEAVAFTSNDLNVLVLSNMSIDIAFRKNQLVPTHYCEFTDYAPNTPCIIQSHIENPYDINISALSMRVSIPYQWTMISLNGNRPPDNVNTTDNSIIFIWISGMNQEIDFTYTLQPSSIAAGPKTITADIVYRISDDSEITTPLSPDIHLNRQFDPNLNLQGNIYLGESPAPYTAQVDVSLMYFSEKNTLEMIEIKSDGPNYILSFVDPNVQTYTVFASFAGYLGQSYIFEQLPEIQNFYLTKATQQSIQVTEITEPDSLKTTKYEKELPSIQIGKSNFITTQSLEAQTKEQQVLATIEIETGSLKQLSTAPAEIKYTLREGISSTAAYVSKSNGILLEIRISNAEITPQRGIRISIPLETHISISDFLGDQPPYAVFHAPNKSDLFEGTNIKSIPPENLLEIKDQRISFVAHSLSVFSVGKNTYHDDSATQTSSDDSGGGCFLEGCQK